MSTYNFYNQKNTVTNTNEVKQSPETIQKKILETYDKYMEMSASDLTIKEMANEDQYLSSLIVKHYNELKQSTDREKIAELNQVMMTLDSEHEKLKQRRLTYLETEFKWLNSNYPQIFNLIIGAQPPARQTLESVLNAFLASETGQIDRKSAMKTGLESLRKQHNLPSDFFDYEKLDQYC